MRRPWRQVLKRKHLLALATVALVMAWFFLLRPQALGGPTAFIMVSGTSMEPTLDGGDLALVRQQDRYRRGEIVAFRVPKGESGEGAIVIHRIVGQTAEGFVTQGDNRERPDIWRPGDDDMVGRMWFSVPGGGRLLVRLLEPLTLGLLAGGLGMVLVLLPPDPGWHLRLPLFGRRKGRPAEGTEQD